MGMNAGGLIAALWLICTALAILGSAYLVFAAILLGQLRARVSPPLHSARGVTIPEEDSQNHRDQYHRKSGRAHKCTDHRICRLLDQYGAGGAGCHC
jgi:hypothetical protein